MMMLYDFPYLLAGFEEEEWEAIPRIHKVMIRDYHLHGGNVEQASFFSFMETDRTLRDVRTRYCLRGRPLLQVSLADLKLPFRNSAAVAA